MFRLRAFKLPIAESRVLGEHCNPFEGKSGELTNALNGQKSDKKAGKEQTKKRCKSGFIKK